MWSKQTTVVEGKDAIHAMQCHANQGDTRVFGKLHERHVEFNQQIFLIIIMGNFFWMLCCQSTVMVYMEIFNIFTLRLLASLLNAQIDIDGFLCYYLVGSPLYFSIAKFVFSDIIINFIVWLEGCSRGFLWDIELFFLKKNFICPRSFS